VHLAPAFGEDDFRICVREGIVEKDDRYSVYLLYWYQSTNTDAYISNMSCVDEQGRFTGRLRMLEVLVFCTSLLY
jgi:isoleucyl-tRNA synthetase